jgi:amidophosphoribosyltransferase
VEGSGIVASGTDDKLNVKREPGMVRDVFSSKDLDELQGDIAIGHNRYSTNGGRHAHLQPVISDTINFAFAHNGNIPDTTSLEEYLTKRRYITGKYNDSELFGNTIASKLHGGRELVDAVAGAEELAVGAYSCVAMHDGTLVGFRDSHGIRPLEIGKFEGGIILASETCALDTVGAEHIRSVNPGELIAVRNGEIVSTQQMADPAPTLDVFEMVYFARHDSYLQGQRVNEVRRKFGQQLAKLHAPWQQNQSSIVVTAVPDTSLPAAEGYAAALGLPHESAIIKNRYIGRTFMQPSQDSRRSSLRLKHTMISERIKDRDVYMIDDSIVRGNTLPRLVELAKNLGARSVSVLIASPPIRFSDFYGVDTPEQSELMAANMTVEAMRKEIDADYLGFLSVSAMVEATGIPANELNLASFTGEYPVSIGKRAGSIHAPVSAEYME